MPAQRHAALQHLPHSQSSLMTHLPAVALKQKVLHPRTWARPPSSASSDHQPAGGMAAPTASAQGVRRELMAGVCFPAGPANHHHSPGVAVCSASPGVRMGTKRFVALSSAEQLRST